MVRDYATYHAKLQQVVEEEQATEPVVDNVFDDEFKTGDEGLSRDEQLFLNLWAKSQQISNDLGELGDEYAVLDSIEHPETGETLELERVERHYDSLLRWDNERVVNARVGNQIPSVLPKEREKITPEMFFRAYNNQHEEKVGLDDESRVQQVGGSVVLSTESLGVDSIDGVLNGTETATKAEMLASSDAGVSERVAEMILSRDLSELSKSDVDEILDSQSEDAGRVLNEAQLIDERRSDGEIPVVDYYTSYSTYLAKNPCGRDCNGCPHGPYLKASFRDDSGQVKNKYIG